MNVDTTGFGSLTNAMLQNNNVTTIEVGMGATQLSYTDRYPYTVTNVVNKKTIGVKPDTFKRTDNGGPHTEMQSYEYELDDRYPEEILTLRKDGTWRPKGYNYPIFRIGKREAYIDPCF